MKKLMLVCGVFVALSLTSCKKDYVCSGDIGGINISQEYPGLDKDQAAAQKKDCEAIGGTWSVK